MRGENSLQIVYRKCHVRYTHAEFIPYGFNESIGAQIQGGRLEPALWDHLVLIRCGPSPLSTECAHTIARLFLAVL